MNSAEAQLRSELAACYRLFDWLGWTELIFNHITVRLPGHQGGRVEYLINPFGLHYAEVTPANQRFLCLLQSPGKRVACGGDPQAGLSAMREKAGVAPVGQPLRC